MSVDLFLIVKAWQSQCLKLHVMNQLSREQHTSPITLLKPYELHLMARSPALSHTISPLFSLLCFDCWVVRSGPNWLIYSTINWSRAVWLIKTCNRLQGERKGRGGWGTAAIQMTLLDISLSGQIYNLWDDAFSLYCFFCWYTVNFVMLLAFQHLHSLTSSANG